MGASFKIDISEVKKMFKTLPTDIEEKIVVQTIKDTAVKGRNELRRATQKGPRKVKFRTGNLFGSIQMTTLSKITIKKLKAIIGWPKTTPYAKWLNDGTGIHGPTKRPIIIKAIRAKALKFSYQGKIMFRKSVRVLGIKPRRFIEDAQKKAEKAFPVILTNNVNKFNRSK